DGNTVVVIEHNLDVIKTADWIVDLGPEGGHRGGNILANGTPEHIASLKHSHTGHFLAPVLERAKVHAAASTASTAKPPATKKAPRKTARKTSNA
ncbi:MAG: hypothetical protein ABIR20_10670, partial [Lysobacter sp.]